MIGIAMIARNSAKTMERALEPFVGAVDEIAIVLGGTSADETPEITKRLATLPAQSYNGPLDDEGRLLDFAAARQQSFDALSAPWAVLVDTDDEWQRAEVLPQLITDLEKQDFAMVQIPVSCGGGEFLQPRIFRRDSGKWVSPVHEYWQLNNDCKVIKTDWVRVVQNNKPSKTRPEHNIAIAEVAIQNDFVEPRLLALLAKDYCDAERWQDALLTVAQYLAITSGENKEELFEAHYCQAAAHLRLKQYPDALRAGSSALAVQPYGHAWTLKAEAALLWAIEEQARGLYEMALLYADQALDTGRSRTALWTCKEMVTTIPLQLKARALMGLGRRQEALAAFDLGLAIDATNVTLLRLRSVLCAELGVLE